LGQTQRSAEDFAIASKNVSNFYSLGRLQWAELLVRSGQHILATRRIHANRLIHNRNQWNAYVARCHWILGWCALVEGKLNVAEAKLRQAEAVFHRGQLLFDLARLHLTAGELAIARRDADDALYYAEEALTLAAPRGMRFVHADALVLRGRARLLEDAPDAAERALDDAEEALRLARECGYAWGERDALFLETEARKARAVVQQLAGDELAARREHEVAGLARDEAEALAAKLVLTDEDLAAAEVKAVAWLNDWKKKSKE
jgi:tetratricopeptide (TPR) repeat protein